MHHSHKFRFAKSALLLTVFATLVGCKIVDPGYDALVASADKDPDPLAVVGMWHRPDRGGLTEGIVMSMLLKRDGNGHVDAVVRTAGVLGDARIRHEIGDFRWTYDGNGIWSLRNAAGRVDYCRMSGGKLLREYHSVPWFLVYERVQ